MKKNLSSKKLVVMLLVVAILSVSTFSSVFADKVEENSGVQLVPNADKQTSISDAQMKKEISLRNEKLIEYLKSHSSKDVKSSLENFLSENKLSNIKNVEKPSLIKVVYLDKQNSIYFYNDGTVALETLTSGPVLSSALYDQTKNSTLTYAPKYKFASNDRYYYGAVLGNLLFHVHIEANFGYDGSKAWYAGGLWGYYERGTLSAWQVSNWETGTTVINNGEYCRAYARGNFHWGIEYEGNGLVVQDEYVDLRVSVTRNGDVWKN
ncbi:hypothetical protein EDC21_12128 [Thermohydrogenium kirishiense]|nr:hypothetical protein EDC21_12128 [Thermohydrogenium kirishiense]